jgi:hypothetical protein
MENSKFEIRSTKQYRNSNVQITKTFGILNFCHLNLFRISKLDIRTSHALALLSYFVALVTFIFVFSGCSSYSSESMFSQDISSVCLEMFDNQTYWRGVEYELSDALAKRIEAQTPYKIISSKDRADTVISGQITSINESALSTQREMGTVLETEVQLQAVVNWKNLKTGELLIDNQTVSAEATYSPYQNQDFSYASALAANNLARKIVELMEKGW